MKEQRRPDVTARNETLRPGTEELKLLPRTRKIEKIYPQKPNRKVAVKPPPVHQQPELFSQLSPPSLGHTLTGEQQMEPPRGSCPEGRQDG
ncbi:unnamed protein product [Arctogadus glacialis]